ncbi:MAG: hypothetical protein IJL21_04800 [Alphaproteobacteria bacterium]|nr:hypothetical protein [Alphaproteobacteria bacterium]
MKKFTVLSLLFIVPIVAVAATAKKQSAIQNGTNVRARVAATGVYSQECYDEYYGCMDQFCISENINGGSCLCSNNNEKYESELEEINEILAEADRIKTVEVERIKLGADADIVFTGERKYDANGNVIQYSSVQKKDAAQKVNKKQEALKLFEVNLFEDDEDDDDVMHKTGAALFAAADETCRAQLGNSCAKDIKLLKQIYQRQIESDCRGFANAIAQQRTAAVAAMNSAESDVRNALKESFDSANKFNQGECMVELKKCMLGADACGDDWANCVSIIANENMQNKSATSTANTKVKTTIKYNITPSVLERLESKRAICERVLDQCMAVRDNVWTAFLREVAPNLKLAELRAESNMRQSCLSEITNCIHTACRDDIAGKGTATMDSCLSRPDMARSFCKVQIDPCERMEPLIWGYVVDKLAAMRVDACTAEVKDCIYSPDRCGPDFMNCIGMDWEFVHGLCPLDKLVVCKKNNPNFKMEDIDSMIMGLYLNMDNKSLDNCQKLVEDKMMEICGSTTDCNRFTTDETIGTGSLRGGNKDGNIYRITGMISFGAIKVGNGATTDDGKKLDWGKIGVADYMTNAGTANGNVPNKEEILETIKMELTDISENVNRVIDMIASDPKIQFCTEGRSLDQITGEAKTTVKRFPNLLNQVKMQIALAALRQAQTNYQAKYNEYLTKATKDASADIAQYMCQMLPMTGGAPVGGTATENVSLAPPYAISYEVAAGLNNALLTQGGRDSSATTGTVKGGNSNSPKQNAFVATTGAILSGGVSLGVDALSGVGGKSSYEIPGGTREMWATFNRDTRTCRLCSSTVTRDCVHTYKRGFLGIGHKDETNCTESEPIEKCEDIQM